MSATPGNKTRRKASGGSYRAIAAYYDPEYAHYDWLAQDVPYFLERLKRDGRQRVLEVAVGTGRAGIPLAQAGHRVLGVDYDPDVLEIARRKRDAVGLGDRELELVRGDATALELDAPRFDWACILFNTFLNFTTLERQDAVLQGVRRHLKRGTGRLWLDVFNPNPALLAEDRSEGLDPFIFYVPEYERTVYKTTDVRREMGRQVQRVTFRYQWFDRDGVLHREQRAFELTFMFPRELQLLVERNGFELESLHGDYDASEVTARSPRLIACCRAR